MLRRKCKMRWRRSERWEYKSMSSTRVPKATSLRHLRHSTQLRAGGLAISDDELFINRSAQLAELAVRSAVPAVFEHREFVAAGGLMSYGSDLTETYHQAGVFSGLILKGGNTADLPVYQSTKVEFLINLRTAKSLGLTVPPALLSRANEVIQ